MKLYNYQIEQVERIREIWKRSQIAFDFSYMGSGKTVTAIELAKSFGNVVIISLPSVIRQSWQTYDLEYDMLTINTLRGMKNSLLRHNYLTREDTFRQTIFAATEHWQEICEEGCLLIVDEIHMVKNKNIGFAAIKTLIQTVAEHPASKALLMTGTPFDQPEQRANYEELVGSEITDLIAVMSPQLQHRAQGYYYFARTSLVDTAEINLSLKTTDLLKMEMAKVSLFQQTTLNLLLKAGKIVIALFYLEPIAAVARALRAVKPLVITGNVPEAERRRRIALFQAPDNRHRVLVANMNIISTGINLDDTDGRFPRRCLLSPNFHTMATKQLECRFLRATTKSAFEMWLLFSQNSDEKKILDRVEDKLDIITEFNRDNSYVNFKYLDKIDL